MSLILHDPGARQHADGRARAAGYGRPPGDLRHLPDPDHHTPHGLN